MGLVNPRSIVAKINDLKIWIQANCLHVVSIVESWLNDGIPDDIVAPSNYSVFRWDRPSRGGGVCIIIDRSLRPTRVIPQCIYQDLEIVSVDLNLPGNAQWRVITVYCPPVHSGNSDYIKLLTDCIRSMTSHTRKTIVTGDFNRPGIQWRSWDNIECSSLADRSFVHLMGEIGMTQIATFPTRGTNYLSLVFCNAPYEICSIGAIPPFNYSDIPPHLPIKYSIASKVNYPQDNTKLRNYAKIDYGWANDLIGRYDMTATDSIEKFYLSFHDIINTISSSAPFRRVFKHRPLAWNLAKIKNKAWSIYRSYPTDVNQRIYYNISMQYKEAAAQLRSQQLKKLCNQSDRAAFYHHNSPVRGSASLSALCRGDGGICANDTERAQELLLVFNRAYRQDQDVDFTGFSNIDLSVDYGYLFSASSILKRINSLKIRTATGPDNIPAIILKKLGPNISPLISILFHRFFLEDWIPPIWRLATVVPVFKGKGSTSDAANYRPIALTSIISKVYEKCILEFLLNFSISTDIIPSSQFGGLPGRSATLQLIYNYDQWTSLRETNTPYKIFFLDITKAYDRIPRSKLASCLCDLGIPHIVVRAIMRLFNQRHHRVKVGSCFSTTSPTPSGVVQGTVLGCILFILYTAPLTAIIRPIIVHAFIDDFKWTVTADQDTNVQSDLGKVINWLTDHGLDLSINKTRIMNSGRSSPGQTYTFSSGDIGCCSSHTDLGIIMKSDLKFDLHIDAMIFKANRSSFGVLTRFRGCDLNSLTLAFTTYVRPIIEYASPLWSPTYVSMIDGIERVQRTFTRKIFGNNYINYSERCATLRLHSLEWRRVYLDLCLMYSIINTTVYKSPLVNPAVLKPISNTRSHNQQIDIPNSRSNTKRHSFFLRTAIWWNQLPSDIVESLTLKSFKIKLKNYDLNRFCQRFPF